MVVISTGEVNRSGWRLLPEGGDATYYAKNPILLFQHGRADKWDKPESQRLPIGRIENLRLEDGKWVADDPIFDDDDTFAVALKKKYEKGMLNAFSPGVIPIETSQDPSVLLPGQTRATVTRWQFLEISLVDIPKDQNATRLCLSSDSNANDIIPELKTEEMSYEKIAVALGLPSDANEDTIVSAIQSMKTKMIDNTIALGVDRGVITKENEGHYRRLAASDLEATTALILSAKTATDGGPDDTGENEEKDEQLTVAKFLQLAQQSGLAGGKPGGDANSREGWDFKTWSQKDPKGLNEMRQENPSKYEQLAAAYGEEA